MSRRYLPPDEALTGVLAGRVDALEHELRRNTGDVTALGRAVTDLTTQIRVLTTNLTPSSPTSSSTVDDPGEDAKEVAGQPDWFAVTDPDDATTILTTLTTWVKDIGAHHGITLPAVCWPLHPDVVADLLALSTERDTAYTGPYTTPVSEWLTRWLPATTDRISTTLSGCVAVGGHRDHNRTYDATGLATYTIAAWWATNRHTPAPHALALPHLY
jgi:hypothetical protein